MSEHELFKLPRVKWVTLDGKKFPCCEHCLLRLSKVSPRSGLPEEDVNTESRLIAQRYMDHLMREHREKLPPPLRGESR